MAPTERVRSLLNRFVPDADAVVLGGLAAVAAAAFLVLGLADRVSVGTTQRLDEWVLRAFRHAADPSNPIGPPWFEEAVRDLTALGGVAVLLVVIGAAAGFLAMNRAWHAMWLTLGSSLGGLVLGVLLKGLFDRPRPDVVPHLMRAASSSFPSGHSLNSAVVYLTLGLILAEVGRTRRQKSYFVGLALTLTGLVGFSRVYLGVHYPTDVLAGWLAGSAWALSCCLLTYYLKRSGSVEEV
ncbi:MAG: phosphatase PAP2 family protein [Thermoleophilia bacterium]|nr:phosphatase PAP2 family protein [Thermoleophilia bacterium]